MTQQYRLFVLVAVLAVILPCGAAFAQPADLAERVPELEGEPAEQLSGCLSGAQQACSDLAIALRDIEGDFQIEYALLHELWSEACDGSIMEACVRLGRLINETEVGRTPTEADLLQGRQLFESACMGGNLDGCFYHALAHSGARGDTPANLEAAATALAVACDAGHGASCATMGWEVLRQPDAGPEARTEALALFRRSCDLDFEEGCTQFVDLAASVPSSWGPGDVPILEEICNQGSALACEVLGVAYFNGNVVALDPQVAREYFELACTYGAAYPCYSSGRAALDLDPPDVEGAIAHFETACTAGVGDACNWLGVVFWDEHPDYPEADPQRAAQAFATGCATGMDSACANLAVLCSEGVSGTCGAAPTTGEFDVALLERGDVSITFPDGVRNDAEGVIWGRLHLTLGLSTLALSLSTLNLDGDRHLVCEAELETEVVWDGSTLTLAQALRASAVGNAISIAGRDPSVTEDSARRVTCGVSLDRGEYTLSPHPDDPSGQSWLLEGGLPDSPVSFTLVRNAIPIEWTSLTRTLLIEEQQRLLEGSSVPDPSVPDPSVPDPSVPESPVPESSEPTTTEETPEPPATPQPETPQPPTSPVIPDIAPTTQPSETSGHVPGDAQ